MGQLSSSLPVLLTPLSCCSLAPEGSPALWSRSPSSPCWAWWQSSQWCGGPGKTRVASGASHPLCQYRPGAPVELCLGTREANNGKPSALNTWSTPNTASLTRNKRYLNLWMPSIRCLHGSSAAFSLIMSSMVRSRLLLDEKLILAGLTGYRPFQRWKWSHRQPAERKTDRENNLLESVN